MIWLFVCGQESNHLCRVFLRVFWFLGGRLRYDCMKSAGFCKSVSSSQLDWQVLNPLGVVGVHVCVTVSVYLLPFLPQPCTNQQILHQPTLAHINTCLNSVAHTVRYYLSLLQACTSVTSNSPAQQRMSDINTIVLRLGPTETSQPCRYHQKEKQAEMAEKQEKEEQHKGQRGEYTLHLLFALSMSSESSLCEVACIVNLALLLLKLHFEL